MSKFCTNCGQEVDGRMNNCPSCGQKINKSNNNAENTNNIKRDQPYEQKSKIAAGILGILLGSLGIHNFYLGFTGKALAQLLISICSCGTLSWISAIWGLIEGIMILTGSINVDANGNPLGE